MMRTNSLMEEVKKETNTGNLKDAFEHIYNDKKPLSNGKTVLREAVKVLNRLTYDERTQLMHRKDISKQPQFDYKNGAVVLKNVPQIVVDRGAITGRPIIMREFDLSPMVMDMMTKKEYIEDRIHWFYRKVGYTLDDYITFFKQLNHERLKGYTKKR